MMVRYQTAASNSQMHGTILNHWHDLDVVVHNDSNRSHKDLETTLLQWMRIVHLVGLICMPLELANPSRSRRELKAHKKSEGVVLDEEIELVPKLPKST